MSQNQKTPFGLQDLSEDARKFIAETKQKLSAAKRRCPVCKQKTPHERLALVQGKIVPLQSALGPVTLKLVMEAAEIPLVEYCTKCGNAPLDPKFLEKQVRFINGEFQKKKRMMELGIVAVQPRGGQTVSSGDTKKEEKPYNFKETPSGLIIPKG